MQLIDTATTRFQRVEVWQSSLQVEFRVEQAVHAWWHQHRYLTGLAWDNIIAGTLLHPSRQPRSVLMLGLAGGTTFHALRHLLPDAALTAVDIDGELIELARKHMHLDSLRCDVHIADAYPWVKQCRQRFDVVIDDVYLAGKTDVYRPGKWNERCLLQLKRLLKPDGILLTNLVRGAGHRVLQSQIRQLYRKHFPCVKDVRTPLGLNETLCGGTNLLGQAALQPWAKHFSQARDRSYWKQIQVRRLPSIPSPP